MPMHDWKVLDPWRQPRKTPQETTTTNLFALTAANFPAKASTNERMWVKHPLKYGKQVEWRDSSEFEMMTTMDWLISDGFATLSRILGHMSSGEGNLAAHSGGSCQASLSFDNGTTWKVIHSYHGGCPRDVKLNSNMAGKDQVFFFRVPAETRAGRALFSWYIKTSSLCWAPFLIRHSLGHGSLWPVTVTNCFKVNDTDLLLLDSSHPRPTARLCVSNDHWNGW